MTADIGDTAATVAVSVGAFAIIAKAIDFAILAVGKKLKRDGGSSNGQTTATRPTLVPGKEETCIDHGNKISELAARVGGLEGGLRGVGEEVSELRDESSKRHGEVMRAIGRLESGLRSIGDGDD